MATNESIFTLRLRTLGMDQAQQQSQAIANNMQAAQQAANQLGGSPASRRVANSAAASPTGMAGASAGIPTGTQVQDYNTARGAAGAAGGTARDFADQARGLGGLVRLYATAAANVYALTAAFGALSRAMDTTNMVKGLDQLGAASGVALGSLSKRLVAATDGAISLREAMEATTKAVSSGMNSTDVLRLGNVAKQASQALGVDMGDAISRLTRGITKLEPELLDELGIFTKLDPAVKEYAKSVNKSVSELSDFERRQAFANAVLAEGEQKFSSIQIDANPYTKLSAAVRDTTQSILEFVNKVIGPVASFFSQSPTALITGITAIAAILVKQALPAIGEFKQGLEQTAQRAQDLAQQKAQQAQQARQLINQRIIDEVESRADAELRAVENAEARIQQLQQGNLNRRSAAFRLLSRDLQDITERDLQRVERAATAMERRGRTAEATAYRDVVGAIRSQITAETDLIATRQRLTQQVERDAQGWGTYGQSVRAGQRAQEAATRSAIISNAAHNASLIGVIASYRLLREEIARNNITGFAAAMLTARGAIAAVGGAISTAMNALNGFFMVIATITAAISIIDGIFSKASKEIAGFSDAVTRTEGATKNLANTFDAIYKTNPFSVQSMEAQANAILEFSSSIDDLAKNAEKALRALDNSGWDKFKNRIKGILNFDIQSTFTETLSEGIVSAVKGIDNKAISDELKVKLSGILNVKDVTNVEQLEKALKGLKPTSATVVEIQRALKGASTEAGIAASKAREFVTAFDASKDAFRELSKQFEVNDATTKWANTSIASLIKLSQNLDGPIAGSIANLVKLSEEIDKAPIFGSSSLEVAKLNTELKNAQQLMIRSEKDAQNLETALKDLKAENVVDAANRLSGINLPQTQTGPAQKIVDQEIARLEGVIREARASRKAAESSAEAAASKISAAINTGLTESVDLVSKGIQSALAKGSTQALQSIYSRIDNIPELAGRQFELKIKELGIQETSIRTQQELSNRISLLTAELAVTNAASTLQKAEAAAKTAGGGQKAETAASDVRTAQKDLEDAAKKLSMLRQAAKDPVGALAALSEELKNTSSGAKGYSKEIVDAANRNAGFIKSLNDIAAQQRIIKNLEEPLAKEAARFKAESDALDTKLRSNATTRESLQLQLSLNKANEVETLEQLRSNQLQQVDLETEKKILQAQTAYNNNLITGAALAKEGKAADAEKVYQAAELAKRESEAAIRAEDRVKRGQVENNITKERLAIYDRTQAKLKEIQDSERQNEQTRQSATLAIRESELGLAETRLSIAEQQGTLGEQFIANARADLELAKQAVAFEKERQALSNQRATAIGELAAKANRQAMANEDNSATIKQMLDLASAFDATAVAQERANSSRTTAINLTRQQSVETAKQNEQLKKQAEILGLFQGIADVLSQAFGKAGAAAGSFISAIGNAITSQENYNTEKSKQLKIISDIDAKERETITSTDLKQKEEASKKLGELEKKNARQELTDNARLVGSAKNLFKEKTVAYKALHNIEKALHIARIAMDLKELATSLFVEKGKVAGSIAGEGAQTAATSAGFFARAGLYVTEIFSKISAQLGVFGPPVAAAIVAAIGLSAFGKKAVQPKGFTAEEQQKVQGTGQTYRDGKLVEREGGVLGDPTAKASGVSKALEFVGRNTFENLEFSNRMVNALKAIEKNTRGLTAAMLRSLGPQAQGSLAGQIQTGEIRGNYLGGNTLVNAGLGAAGGFAAGVGMLSTGLGTAAMAGASALLGITASNLLNFVLPGIGLLLAKPLGKLMGSIFGGKTTKTIEDFGITVNGVLDDVVAGTQGVIEEWANVKTIRKGGWFRSDKTTYDTMTQEATDPIKDIVGNLFMGVRDSLISAGEVLGKDVTSTIGNFLIKDFKISSKDLKPEELAAAIQGEVSIAFNQMAMAAFPEFSQFAQPFEEAGTTIIRLARQVQVFDLAMASISKSTEGMAKMMKVEVSNSLVELAGGLEQFVERNSFYAENFLTEAERLAPVQDAVTKELAKLSTQYDRSALSTINTREQFKAVVDALDLTIPANRELYNSLMNLAPAFAQVYKEAQKITELSQEDLTSRINAARIKALQSFAQLAGDEASAIAVITEQRNLELAELAKYPDAQRAVLESQQKYLYALEDQISAQDKLIKRRDLLKSVIDSVGKAIDNLSNYRKTLLAGDLSTLLPIDKYKLAKSQFEELLLTIEKGKFPETEAQVAAQLEAVNKLPQIADAFLQASRVVNASSGSYVRDLESVTSALDKTDSQLKDLSGNLKGDGQLAAITKALGPAFNEIANNTVATQTLISNFTAAKTATDNAFITLANNTNTQTGEVKVALTKLADEFKLFKEAMMGPDGFKSIKTALVGDTNATLAQAVVKVETAVNTSTQATGAQTVAVVQATLASGQQVANAVDDATTATTQEEWAASKTRAVITQYNAKVGQSLAVQL